MRITIAAQAVPMEIHYHHAWLVWVLFFVGEMLHIALQTDDLARKSKISRAAVLESVGIRVLWRAFACSMIFGLLWYYPGMLSGLLKHVGLPVSDDESAVLAIPMNNFIAGGYGLVLDSLVGYVPFLKSQLPTVDIPVQSALSTAADANVKAGEAIATAQVVTDQTVGKSSATLKP